MQIFTTHRDSLVRTLCFLFALPQLRQIMRGRTETITFQCEGWNFSPQFDEFLRRIAFAAVLLPGRERAAIKFSPHIYPAHAVIRRGMVQFFRFLRLTVSILGKKNAICRQ
jgi:hypothetical protein